MADGRIGVIGAMDSELAALIAALTQPAQETVQGLVFRTGRLGAREVVLVRCGIGKVSGVVVGVPVKLGKNGAEQVIELKLTAEESAVSLGDSGVPSPVSVRLCALSSANAAAPEKALSVIASTSTQDRSFK